MLEYPIYSGEPFMPNRNKDGSICFQFITGVDPGPDSMNVVVYDWRNERVEYVGYEIPTDFLANSMVVVEKIMCYGMPVSTSIFKTVFNAGYRTALWSETVNRGILCLVSRPWIAYVARKDVKMHFCNSMRAKDGNIRAALIDRFGEPGTKKSPGILYGIKKDWWAALAVAVYASDWLAEQQSNRIGG